MTANEYTIHSSIDRHVRLTVDESTFGRDDIRLLLLLEDEPSTGINIPAYHMVNALRGLGHLPESKELADAHMKLHRIKEAIQPGKPWTTVANEILEIIDPKPPYEFPTGFGAVIKCVQKDGGMKAKFVRISHPDLNNGVWKRQGYFGEYTETTLRNNFTDHETLSEGIK